VSRVAWRKQSLYHFMGWQQVHNALRGCPSEWGSGWGAADGLLNAPGGFCLAGRSFLACCLLV